MDGTFSGYSGVAMKAGLRLLEGQAGGAVAKFQDNSGCRVGRFCVCGFIVNFMLEVSDLRSRFVKLAGFRDWNLELAGGGSMF